MDLQYPSRVPLSSAVLRSPATRGPPPRNLPPLAKFLPDPLRPRSSQSPPPKGLSFVLLVLFLLLGLGGTAGGGRGEGGRGSSVYPAAVVYPHHSRQISWKPRVFLYQHFLSNAEANHLVSLARAELKRSAVADNMSGKSTLSDVRTSSGTFISKAKDPIVAGIEDKIAAWTFLPKDSGSHNKDATLSECAQKGISVKPRKGDALLFFNLSPDGTTNPLSLHDR